MKTVGTIKNARWGNVVVERGHYLNAKGPLAVFLSTEQGERLTNLSVNMYRPECSHDSRDLPADCFYVKTWSGNEEFVKDALASGLFRVREDLPVASSGYVTAPVWQIVGSPA